MQQQQSNSSLTEEERALLLKAADKVWKEIVQSKGPGFFSEEVLGFSNAPHHTEWYRVLGNRSLIQIALAAPRGHTKTTCFSVNYPLWEISENPNVRILLVSNAESQSQSFLRQIVGFIERDQNYVDYAGQLKPLQPEKWTAREIIINRSNLKLKDPTISTVGIGGTILSKRADIIICDDILNFENSRTPEQRQKLKDWFHQVLLPVLTPGGRVIFVGTVWHPQDLLNELLADPGWDYRKKFKAVIEEPVHKELWDAWYALRMAGTEESTINAKAFMDENRVAMHEGVQLLWPEYYSYETLYRIMRTNRVAFEKAYQNNIVSREDQKFKEEWLEAAKLRGANLRLVKDLSADARKEFRFLTGGIDLAAGEGEQDDDNFLASLGVRRIDQMVQLVGLEGGKYTPGVWRSTLAERYGGLQHDRIIVESNAYQISLKRDLAEKNLPIVAYHTGGEKFDPFIGVESLAILFENNRIILPYDKSDPYTITLIDRLVDELRQFPVGHTGDSAMAFWMAYTALRDLMPKQEHGFLQLIRQDQQATVEKQKQGPGLPAWVQMARQQKT